MMGGKASRTKGSSYERYIAKRLRDLGLFPEAGRHLEYQHDESDKGRDLKNTQPFAFQLKCYKSTPSIMALKEIQEDDEYPIPCAILKRTQSKGVEGIEVAVLPLEIFLELLCQFKEECDEMDEKCAGIAGPSTWDYRINEVVRIVMKGGDWDAITQS